MIRAIATGRALDWDVVPATPLDESTSGLIAELRVVGRIAEVHGSARRDAQAKEAADQRLESWGSLNILERVGRGSYGEVYRAWDPRLDREVALKLIPRTAASERSPVIEEGRLLARVRHPNAITVYGADCIDGRAGIWMEFIEGCTLEEELQVRGPFAPADVIACGVDVCRALEAVHNTGVVHRDVKAQNVMREATGRIVLMDFGCGVADGSDERVVGGTPVYLAPEVLAGGAATVRSDIYAVGVLLFHLLTRRYPVEGSTLLEIGQQHRANRSASIRRRRSGLPRRLCVAIERATDPDPTKRFSSAADLEAALVRAIQPPSGRGALVAACALVAMVAGLTAPGWRGAKAPAIPFGARDSVLLTAFENLTRDPVLDGTLEYAFERELSNSAFVGVVSRDRVDDTLRRMAKPLDTKVDVAIGREIALRDGGIRALVAGRIEKVGGVYALSTRILRPVDGVSVAGFSTEVRSDAELLAAIRQQAVSVRTALGESLATIAASETALEKVTTPSLRALQLYSQAAAVMGPDRPWQLDAAERLLRDAVAADPSFASAHILLAWTLHNGYRKTDEYWEHVTAAEALADSATEFEREFIRGSVHSLRAHVAASVDGDLADSERRKAIDAYERVLRLQPGHFWTINNLRFEYGQLRRPDDAMRLLTDVADLRPQSFGANIAASQGLLMRGDLDRAERYAERAAAILTPIDRQQYPRHYAWLRLLPAKKAWLEGDVNRAASQLDTVMSELQRGSAQERAAGATLAVPLYMTLGQLRRADALMPHTETGVFGAPAHVLRSRLLWQRDDRVALRHFLSKHGPATNAGASFGPLWAEAGLLSDARKLLEYMAPRERAIDAGWAALIRSHLALAEGRYRDALAYGQFAIDRNIGPPLHPNVVLAAVAMADAAYASGQLQRAIKVLERYSAHRAESFNDGLGGFIWIAARAKLAGLYRQASRNQDAEAIDHELLRLLSIADRDLPLLLRLHAQRR
jgi:tetratricopeptide (TPR) repeat protein